MKRILLCLGALLAGASLAPADIIVRISVKAVLNPATGGRQSGVSDLVFSNTVVSWSLRRSSSGVRSGFPFRCSSFRAAFMIAVPFRS